MALHHEQDNIGIFAALRLVHAHSVRQLQLLHLTLSVGNVISLGALRKSYRNIFSVYFNYTADIAVENILS